MQLQKGWFLGNKKWFKPKWRRKQQFAREDEKLANNFQSTLTGESSRLKQIEQARAKFQKKGS